MKTLKLSYFRLQNFDLSVWFPRMVVSLRTVIFIGTCEVLVVTAKTTPGESPWSNKQIERHNLILAEILDKVLNDTQCHPDLKVYWRVNAQDSLYSAEASHYTN